MDGMYVLITDFNEGLSRSTMQILVEKKAIPFVLIKDFENGLDIFDEFPTAVPIVLNPHQSIESTLDHISSIPNMDCIINFDGDNFENLYRQFYENLKSFSIRKDAFEITKSMDTILDANIDGYPLMINIVPLSHSTKIHGSLLDNNEIIPSYNSAHNLKFVFEKLFSRKFPLTLNQPTIGIQKRKDLINNQRQPVYTYRSLNPLTILCRKVFTRFNPCCSAPISNYYYVRSSMAIKTPEDIKLTIRSQEAQEIRTSLRTIHKSALANWTKICETNFKFTPDLEQQLRRMCQEIERKGEEGRRTLLDKIRKDIDRTKQWDHVLGAKTVNRLKTIREKETEKKVQQFCNRKIIEARRKIDEEIKQSKARTKCRFYIEILDEQVMELMRIKEKYRKRLELLMLPYTGEFNVLNS
ncbi:unnamed protein product [Orchesella dallaii]|uniref:Uncharacterized protein n=1 Tax=Orchesella dallaii TaxID=48710 RepID=A0ABP1PS02_9HEXA